MTRRARAREKRANSAAPPRIANRWLEGAGIWLVLLGAAIVAYWPALSGEEVWDDSSHITVPALQSIGGLWKIWSQLGATQQYYPVLHSAFWFEHRLWGDAVTGYHLANIALHAACGALVVLIVRRLSLPGSWLAGLIFTLHPVHVESVAWISEQKSTRSGFFCLAAMLVYLHFDEKRLRRLYLGATALFALAILSKSVTAVLPAALLVVLWWRRGKLGGRRDALPLAPWFVVGAAMGLFTAWVERSIVAARGAAYSLTVIQHILLAGRDPWFYAMKLVAPYNLTFSYPRWNIDPSQWWQYLFPIGVIAVAAACVMLARRTRGPLTAVLVFLVALFPVLGFLNVYPFRYSWVADHFQYLASLALIVPGAALLTEATGRLRQKGALRIAAAAGIAAVLAILTFRQSGMYRNEETLYRETLARNPESGLAHNNLGVLLSQTPGHLPEAIAEFRAAVRIPPDNPEAHNNLGSALAHSGEPGSLTAAVAEFQAALRLKPDFGEAHENLGNAFLRIPGKLPEAVAEYRLDVRADPNSAEAHARLANALALTPGELTGALAEYQTSLRLQPDSVWALLGLGNTLAQIPGRLPEAVEHYRHALRLDPENADAHVSLAVALSEMPGHEKEAMGECESALRLNPNLSLAQHLLEHLTSL